MALFESKWPLMSHVLFLTKILWPKPSRKLFMSRLFSSDCLLMKRPAVDEGQPIRLQSGSAWIGDGYRSLLICLSSGLAHLPFLTRMVSSALSVFTRPLAIPLRSHPRHHDAPR
jgi:hypothetical protein